MRDTIVEAFEMRGDSVTVSDLYAMSFNPVASASDFRTRADPDHLAYGLEQRHALQHGTLAPDIAAEVDRVVAADLLAFTFPLFWFSTPAILKGWIDRVFLSGAFYGGRRIYDRGGLAGKRALVAFSLGGRAHMFGPGSVHGELETGMLRHFLQGTLGYVGLAVHQPFVAYHVPYIDREARRLLLDQLRACVLGLDDRPQMSMPSLADYDDMLAPLERAV
jgi:NAD(P)H dehydrogenase (quinone)